MAAGTSIAAVSEHGELLAVRLGVVRGRDMWGAWLADRQTCRRCFTMFGRYYYAFVSCFV